MGQFNNKQINKNKTI